MGDQAIAMPPNPPSLADPRLLEVLLDLDAMSLWECLRRQRAPITAEALARLSNHPAPLVQRTLDALEVAGLLRKLKARGRRRSVAYAVAIKTLSIEFDRSDPVQRAAVERVIRYVDHEVPAELFRDGVPLDALTAAQWHFHLCTPLALDADDLVELKRRIAQVETFIALLRDRATAASDSTASPLLWCNHAISIRIEPLATPLLPQPVLELVSRATTRERAVEPGLRPKHLSAREREVARALRQGASRATVAQRLGLSVLTVGTLCKRIYRKLGIRRASELQQFDLR